MYSVLCPVCHFVNPADAGCCRACNAAFFLDSDRAELDPAVAATRRRRRGLQALSGSSSAEALPAPAEGAADDAPRRRAADSDTADEGEPSAGDAAPPLHLVDPLAGAAEHPPDSAAWSAGGLPPTPPIDWPDLPSQPTPGALTGPLGGPDRRTVAKALARQAARRARLASLMAEASGPPPVDVLVLDQDDATRGELKALLARFGFHVHEALDLGQAERLSRVGPFAAAFLDIRLDEADDGSGIELCQRLHGSTSGGTPVVLMSRRVRPADRVRAALARSDMLLAKPLSRGDVARALESCGVALPADERRR